MTTQWQQPGPEPAPRDRWGGAPQPPPGPFAQQQQQQQHGGYGQQQYGQQQYGQQQHGAYGPPPVAWGAAVRPSRGLGTAALVLSGVYLLSVVLSAATAFSAAERYREVTLAGGTAANELTAYDGVQVLLFVAMLAAYVLTCCWLVRARANSEVMTPHRPTRARGWIWAGWLVPVVALWFPFQVVRDVLRAGRPGAGALLGWWWATWLIGQGLQNSASRLVAFDGSVDPATIGALGPLETAGALSLAVSFVLWVLVVTTIVRDQEARVR